MDSSRAAALIAAAFGLVFVVVNAGAADAPWSWGLRALGVAAAVLAVVRVTSAPSHRLQPDPRAIKVYWASVLLEVLAIFGGTRVLDASGAAEYVIALVAGVVGLHFLPFSWAFREPRFRVLGLALVGVALLGVVAGLLVGGDAEGDTVSLVAGVGAGAVLLAFAATTPRGTRDGATA